MICTSLKLLVKPEQLLNGVVIAEPQLPSAPVVQKPLLLAVLLFIKRYVVAFTFICFYSAVHLQIDNLLAGLETHEALLFGRIPD